MKQNRLAGALAGVALLWLASGAWAQVTISNLVVAQRAGTKLVDITYDVSSAASHLFVTLSVSNGAAPVVVTTLSGDVGDVVPGTGKSIVWNMEADWDGNQADLLFGLTVRLTDYMVVDLSAGPTVTNYPVSYLDAVPSGGWGDEYKTTKLVLLKITRGTFTMGSPTNEVGHASDELQHSVTLTKDFFIGVYEVTQKQWAGVMGDWPSYFTNATYRDSRPVEMVSYNAIRGVTMGTNWPADNNVDSNSFMGRLRAKTGLEFDLPTEAQWEYACRAWTTTALNSGYNLTNTAADARMAEVGRYDYNCSTNSTSNADTSGGTAKVGSYLPNALGLYDMHGNVWEWCLDWYGAYPGTVSDPLGASSGTDRVRRGGYWNYTAGYCRSGNRDKASPAGGGYMYGFRIARILP